MHQNPKNTRSSWKAAVFNLRNTNASAWGLRGAETAHRLSALQDQERGETQTAPQRLKSRTDDDEEDGQRRHGSFDRLEQLVNEQRPDEMERNPGDGYEEAKSKQEFVREDVVSCRRGVARYD